MRLQVLLMLDCTIRMEGDVVCGFEKRVLLCEEMLLNMGIVEAAHESVPHRNIGGGGSMVKLAYSRMVGSGVLKLLFVASFRSAAM